MFTPFHSQSVRRIFHISAFFSPKKRPFYDIWVQTPHDICSSTLCEPMCCDYCYFAFVSLGYLFCKLSVRISNLTKSFLLSQRRNARRLFRTTSLAGGFLHTKNSGLATGFQLLLFAHFCFWGIIIFCSQSTIVHLHVFYATYIFCPAKFHAPSTAIKVVIVNIKFKV